MTNFKKLTISVVVNLALSYNTTNAATLATAPASALIPSLQTITCEIVNLSTKPKKVVVELFSYQGNLVQPSASFTLAPNNGQGISNGGGNGAWCRFTVEGSTSKYRAAAVYDNGSAYTIAIPAK